MEARKWLLQFQYKTGSTDRLYTKRLFSQSLPEKRSASEYEIFSLIFEKIINHLVTAIDRYAQNRNDHDFHITQKGSESLLEFYSCPVTTQLTKY